MAELPEPLFVPVILAGGSGTRFWPMSQPEKPKQYLTLFGHRSLIQATADRLKLKTNLNHIFICSGDSQKDLLKEQLPEISQLILEPSGRNTAPCLMLSVATLLARGYPPSTVMGVFPADHFIGNQDAFLKVVDWAVQDAYESGGLVTLGIRPTSPHTGYGYIEASATAGPHSLQVNQFVEKPSLEKASQYLKQGNYFWNGGIFFWRLDSIVEAFQQFLPQEWNLLVAAIKNNSLDLNYSRLTSQPIDIAILEKARNVRVIPVEMSWSDIGSWNALLEHHQQLSGKDNIILPESQPEVSLIDSTHCLVATELRKKIVLIGVQDLIVVETEKGLLISHRSQDQKVKTVV
jgi:mannose-1-phosphate guanylyltransferase